MGLEKAEDETWLAALRAIVGEERLSLNPTVLEQHAKDESFHHPRMPAAVAFAKSTQEVSQILALCNEFGRPVVGFGAGSSLEGHVVPPSNKVFMSLK